MRTASIKRSKFNVRNDAIGKAARTVDGILFASVKEAKHYVLLRQFERAKQITNLIRQPRFSLWTYRAGECVHVCDYVADFMFERDGKQIVEDVKGMDTDISALKRKWLKLQQGIDVVIV